MNDPHVESLSYRIKHGDHVDYSKVQPRQFETSDFVVLATAQGAEVSLKTHCPSAEVARSVVEPFLQAWELDMNLKYGPQSLQFVYERPVIVDRMPTRGVIALRVEAAHIVLTGGKVQMCVGFAQFPQPSEALRRDATVDLMYARYVAYREGRTLLGDAAHYCLTAVILGGGGKRQHAARCYGIADKVLGKIGHLADHKGGAHARKAKGSAEDFTSRERQWLEEAMRILIRRAAEVAYDPQVALSQITMADLPPLNNVP